jgi:ADP-heptose:LPS heptosyltransferase
MKKGAALAICTTALGDTLLCTPAISSLGAVYDLDVLVHQHRRALLWHNPAVKGILSYRNNGLVRAWLALRLAGRRYEVVVVLHANSDVKKLLPFLRYAKAGNIQGWEDAKLKLSALRFDQSAHIADQRLRLAEWAGAPPVDTRMRMYVTDQEKAWAEDWLRQHGLGPDRPRLAMCPGAAYPYKMWPAENFGALAGHLNRRGARCLVVGSGSEKPLADKMQAASDAPLVFAMGLSLREVSALIACMDLMVSNDTGPMHIAQSVATPVLGLFGSTSPETIGPRNPWGRVVRAPIICEPCTTKRCPEAGCMQAIMMDDVIAIAERMLAAVGPEPKSESKLEIRS